MEQRRAKDRRVVNGINTLMPEQSSVFLEVVEASLRITRREQFFSWLQGSCQYLIPHEILLCGVRSGKSNEFRFESFTVTRYVTDEHIQVATAPDGVVTASVEAWRRTHRPVMMAEGLKTGEKNQFSVPSVSNLQALQQSELRNIVAHGLDSKGEGISTFFCFSRIPGEVNANHAYLLELLIPHLHTVLTRIVGNAGLQQREESPVDAQITSREREILQWVHKGKTNWEIAGILDISPLTVKNHVQNILRKLNVQNRSHAAVKATQMGLVRV
ncbi:MAG: XrtB/PEP-CTERM-associated transcriptional regulator EpsA [Methylophilaceae bacterium]